MLLRARLVPWGLGLLLAWTAAAQSDDAYADDFVVDDNFGIPCLHPATTLTTGSPESFGVGIGSGERYYSDGDDYCWVIEGAEDTEYITIVFDEFHTEFNHDFVYVFDATNYDDDNLQGDPMSGEFPSPYVVRVPSNKVLIHFVADDTYHANPYTLQLGFAAHFFDSTDGACLNDCGGADHGECVDGLCDCVEAWGPDWTTDCSIATTILEPGETIQINSLPIGEWAYFKIITTEANVNAVVELVDYGAVDADPRLLLATDTVPTLSHYQLNDWFNWYYDCSDVHYLRGTIVVSGVYYVAVTNDVFRAEDPLDASLTLRTAPEGEIPCLLDCNGHGECDSSTGECECDEGWAGSAVNAPQTCRFEIVDVPEFGAEEATTGSVRIGDWDYYKLPEITDLSNNQRSFAVDFASFSPHSYPVAFVRKDLPPKLWEGYLPTYDAFDFDFGDREGFELVQGQRMSILVNASKLELGTYYVGVYNLWGHNGAGEYNSHDTCDYEIRFTEYASGTPCPTTHNGFCDGAGSCDFNTGKCSCPTDRLWRDCSFVATTLDKGETLHGLTLGLDEYAYYLVNIDHHDIKDGDMNLLITVTVTSGDGVPTILAKFGDLPFAYDLSQYDDHDLLSTYYGDTKHQILLDAQELAAKGEGVWYLSVLNPETSTSGITYDVSTLFTDDLDCPTHHNNLDGSFPECSGDGVCVRSLGRCDCDDLYVMDDCSADGVFPVYPGEWFPRDATDDDRPSYEAPPIAPDDWIFFSVTVGCANRALLTYFHTDNEGARPMMVIRKGKLPLMVTGTYDYWDYYAESSHALTQLVYVTSCDDEVVQNVCEYSCCVTPAYPGTYFATGSPDPGVYYVGIYNDASATETITDYIFYADLDASAIASEERCVDCAPGFIGYNCVATCPGVAPTDVYSNSPTGDGEICGGRGTCSFVNDDDFIQTTCDCDDGLVGPKCEQQCPMGHVPGSSADDDEYAIPEVCSGRGECVAQTIQDDGDDDAAVYEAICICDLGFGGDACLEECDSCGAHGTCTFQGARQHCACHQGYVGDQCEFECPGNYGGSAVCSGNGACVVVHDYDGVATEAQCQCDDGYHGAACSLQCPYRGGLECSGNGICVEESTSKATCECFTEYTGVICQWQVNETSVGETGGSGGSKKKTSSAGTGVSTSVSAGLAATAVCLLGLAVAAWLLAERRKREISRYERLVREVGAASSTIITSTGATSGGRGSYAAPDDAVRQLGETPLPEFGEMRDVASSVSPFHSERVNL